MLEPKAGEASSGLEPAGPVSVPGSPGKTGEGWLYVSLVECTVVHTTRLYM